MVKWWTHFKWIILQWIHHSNSHKFTTVSSTPSTLTTALWHSSPLYWVLLIDLLPLVPGALTSIKAVPHVHCCFCTLLCCHKVDSLHFLVHVGCQSFKIIKINMHIFDKPHFLTSCSCYYLNIRTIKPWIRCQITWKYCETLAKHKAKATVWLIRDQSFTATGNT